MLEIELKDGRIFESSAEYEIALNNWCRAKSDNDVLTIDDGLAVNGNFIIRIEDVDKPKNGLITSDSKVFKTDIIKKYKKRLHDVYYGMMMSSGLPREGATWEHALKILEQIGEEMISECKRGE